MEASPRCVESGVGALWTASYEPIYNEGKHTLSSVFITTWPGCSSGGGCSDSPVGQGSSVCIPSNSSDLPQPLPVWGAVQSGEIHALSVHLSYITFSWTWGWPYNLIRLSCLRCWVRVLQLTLYLSIPHPSHLMSIKSCICYAQFGPCASTWKCFSTQWQCQTNIIGCSLSPSPYFQHYIHRSWQLTQWHRNFFMT